MKWDQELCGNKSLFIPEKGYSPLQEELSIGHKRTIDWPKMTTSLMFQKHDVINWKIPG